MPTSTTLLTYYLLTKRLYLKKNRCNCYYQSEDFFEAKVRYFLLTRCIRSEIESYFNLGSYQILVQ